MTDSFLSCSAFRFFKNARASSKSSGCSSKKSKMSLTVT
nr:MAG TPA: hypothetical protein [Caudoviricetes sp.]